MSNLGNTDRILRIVVGIALLVLGWGGIVSGVPGAILKFLGFVPLLTAATGFCPLYLPFGLSSRRRS